VAGKIKLIIISHRHGKGIEIVTIDEDNTGTVFANVDGYSHTPNQLDISCGGAKGNWSIRLPKSCEVIEWCDRSIIILEEK
jgi:hypothetical protein